MGFFAWEASWGRILTLDMLKRRGRVLANRCFLCEEMEETVDHLLLHCSKARLMWDLLLAIVGVTWVLPLTVREALVSWSGSFEGKKRKKSLDGSPSRNLLDCLERKEQDCVQQQCFLNTKDEIFVK